MKNILLILMVSYDIRRKIIIDITIGIIHKGGVDYGYFMNTSYNAYLDKLNKL